MHIFSYENLLLFSQPLLLQLVVTRPCHFSWPSRLFSPSISFSDLVFPFNHNNNNLAYNFPANHSSWTDWMWTLSLGFLSMVKPCRSMAIFSSLGMDGSKQRLTCWVDSWPCCYPSSLIHDGTRLRSQCWCPRPLIIQIQNMNEGADMLPKASLGECWAMEDPPQKRVCILRLMRTMIDLSRRKPVAPCILPQLTIALTRRWKKGHGVEWNLHCSHSKESRHAKELVTPVRTCANSWDLLFHWFQSTPSCRRTFLLEDWGIRHVGALNLVTKKRRTNFFFLFICLLA